MKLNVNGAMHEVDAPADMPLLWALRDLLNLTGTKFGCGMAQCGACTIHLDGAPVRSCVTPVSAAEGKAVTPIAAIATGELGQRIQAAWVAEDVPQCGYCQSGQIMSAVALLKEHPQPTDANIDTAMDGNLCRCGTYNRIRRAIHRAAGN